MTLITFQRSEGIFDVLHQAGIDTDQVAAEHVVEYTTEDGDWLQITYNQIMDQTGRTIAAVDDQGNWYVDGIEHPFSDVIIDLNSIVEGDLHV